MVNGVAASNFIVQEHSRLVLDATTSERVKFQASSLSELARPPCVGFMACLASHERLDACQC